MNENRVAVITGASSGIGLATAEKLSNMGIKLILTARNEIKLNEICNKLNATPIIGDITDKKTQNKLLETAIQKYGRCDILINNAGTIEVGNIEKIDIEKVSEMVKVNVESAFRLIYLFLKEFKKINRGHIINISSVMGTKVRATAGAYSGTKYAIEALSEALRMELSGTNIKISCIEPGLVMTKLHREWDVHPSKSMGINNPLKPSDIAEKVMYILNQPEHVRIPKLMILPSDHEI